jgi:hypothetical protein
VAGARAALLFILHTSPLTLALLIIALPAFQPAIGLAETKKSCLGFPLTCARARSAHAHRNIHLRCRG